MTRIIMSLLLLLIALAACAPAAEPPTATSAPDTPAATATAAPRVSIPTFAFVQPTVAPQIATAAATATAAAPTAIALEPTAVARGRERYVALGCAECHGDAGQGAAGVEGGALNDLMLTEDEFITFMRSGGTVGASHQYSTNRLSASGGRSLYLYLLSLKNET
jgi:mono/diheme cytochrome c family protein